MKLIGSLSFLSHIIQLKYRLCHESDTDLLDHLQRLIGSYIRSWERSGDLP